MDSLTSLKPVSKILKWMGIACLIGVMAGCVSAIFLLSLDRVTEFREGHRWMLFFLPLAGLFIGWVYESKGKGVEKGNNLILEEIHSPQKMLPLRMAPLIFVSTLLTHLFGGSAGREGTAVQMGSSLADQLTRFFTFDAKERNILLMAGMSAGFAAVFGTPLAGAIFGIEVLVLRTIYYEALLPCFIAAIVGDQVTLLLGVHHAHYDAGLLPSILGMPFIYIILAGIAFGFAARGFSWGVHEVGHFFKKSIHSMPLRLFAGGILMIFFTLAWGQRYLGLGLPTIHEAFLERVPSFDFLGKMAATIVTLGSGFKGGEVTPLFFIGATLGNALASLLALPFPLLAAAGFVAVFAGASNTPLACTLMAIEIFGPDIAGYAAVACVMSYFVSGHQGIYSSQSQRPLRGKMPFRRKIKSK